MSRQLYTIPATTGRVGILRDRVFVRNDIFMRGGNAQNKQNADRE
jgi:hypothetical protein